MMSFRCHAPRANGLALRPRRAPSAAAAPRRALRVRASAEPAAPAAPPAKLFAELDECCEAYKCAPPSQVRRGQPGSRARAACFVASRRRRGTGRPRERTASSRLPPPLPPRLPPQKFDFSADVLAAFDALKAAGALPKWNGAAEMLPQRRNVMPGELRQVRMRFGLHLPQDLLQPHFTTAPAPRWRLQQLFRA